MKQKSIKETLHTVIFGTDTPAGRNFDLILIFFIVLSVSLVILESVPSYQALYGDQFYLMEVILTTIFIIEYFMRIYTSRKRMAYIFSFFGIVDFLSSFSTLFGLILPGARSLLVVRSLRLLRIFRILKLARYFDQGMIILEALRASRAKISVFLFSVLIIILISGTTMYLVEGPDSGFTSIPISMYWAIVTLTTVGYGDIAPATSVGRVLASMLMIVGYSIIAVPTGIVTSELTKAASGNDMNLECKGCHLKGHAKDAVFCRHCGLGLSI